MNMVIVIIVTSRPLYGGGSGVCTYFVYVYIGFLLCWSPLDVFGTHFAVLGTTLNLLLGAFVAPWAPKGLSWVSLWPFWDSLGTPWDRLGGSNMSPKLTKICF